VTEEPMNTEQGMTEEQTNIEHRMTIAEVSLF